MKKRFFALLMLLFFFSTQHIWAQDGGKKQTFVLGIGYGIYSYSQMDDSRESTLSSSSDKITGAAGAHLYAEYYLVSERKIPCPSNPIINYDRYFSVFM